jgi:hypothetical protein
MAPGRAQLGVGQISVRCLGKSTVAKRGKREIVAQLGGSDDLLDGRPQIVESAFGRDPRQRYAAFLSFRLRLIISPERVRLLMASSSAISSGKSGSPTPGYTDGPKPI